MCSHERLLEVKGNPGPYLMPETDIADLPSAKFVLSLSCWALHRCSKRKRVQRLCLYRSFDSMHVLKTCAPKLTGKRITPNNYTYVSCVCRRWDVMHVTDQRSLCHTVSQIMMEKHETLKWLQSDG